MVNQYLNTLYFLWHRKRGEVSNEIPLLVVLVASSSYSTLTIFSQSHIRSHLKYCVCATNRVPNYFALLISFFFLSFVSFFISSFLPFLYLRNSFKCLLGNRLAGVPLYKLSLFLSFWHILSLSLSVSTFLSITYSLSLWIFTNKLLFFQMNLFRMELSFERCASSLKKSSPVLSNLDTWDQILWT